MFKVGSKVRCVANEYETFDLGGEYRVVEYHYGCYCTLINKHGHRMSMFLEPDFIPVSEALSVRSTDPVTSKGKRRVNKYEQAILNLLDCEPHGPQNAGLTGKEMAVYTGHPLNCITPRFAPLRRRGLIQPKMVDGNIVKRDKQIVWVLA